MKKIIFATGNEDKMKEIRMILSDLEIPVYSMREAGVSIEIEETGKTFQENAIIKAQAVKKEADRLVALDPIAFDICSNAVVLADDSGLEIDYLNKEPGVYSARYLGENTPYEIKNRTILQRLAGVQGEDRSARFVCAIAAAFGDRTVCVKETMEGRIAEEPKGENGFGYDPIFYLPEYGCTSAQLAPEEKNACSHRGKALRAIRKSIAAVL